MSKTINILITIDTDGIKKAFPNGGSKDSNNPTGLDHQKGFMIASGTTINSGQGTGDLSIKALVGDTVLRAFATSGSDNFEDAVLLYGMPKFRDDYVFGPFHYQDFTKTTVLPKSNTEVLPARTNVEENFWFYEADVKKKGKEGYAVKIGLYTRSPDTGEHVLYGYFWWDPEITVAG